jgi:hypothetical protein
VVERKPRKKQPVLIQSKKTTGEENTEPTPKHKHPDYNSTLPHDWRDAMLERDPVTNRTYVELSNVLFKQTFTIKPSRELLEDQFFPMEVRAMCNLEDAHKILKGMGQITPIPHHIPVNVKSLVKVHTCLFTFRESCLMCVCVCL